MPFKIVRDDITRVKADVIVNTANPKPIVGDGTDRAIYAAAGEKELLAERKKIGEITRGNAVATPAFNLAAKYIIHTVGPVWENGNHGEREILHSCYARSLALAAKLKAKSIAFPMIATGVYGFPKDEALGIAVKEISEFLLRHDMNVILVVFDRKSFELSGRLINEIDEYIDENGVGLVRKEEYGEEGKWGLSGQAIQVRRLQEEMHDRFISDLSVESHSKEFKKISAYKTQSTIEEDESLDELLKKKGKSFHETLLDLIIASGMEDKEIYRASSMDRKLYSRIRCNTEHIPRKKNILALGIGLKLDMQAMNELLASAGYVISRSDITDLIVSNYIKKGKYDIFELNTILFEYGQDMLGNNMTA